MEDGIAWCWSTLPRAPAIDGMPLQQLAAMQDQLNDEFYDLLAASVFIPHTRELSALAELAEHESNGTVGGFVDAAVKLIHARFKYEKGATHVNSSIQDSLESRVGSLPGLRASADRSGAGARPAGEVRVRLPGPEEDRGGRRQC